MQSSDVPGPAGGPTGGSGSGRAGVPGRTNGSGPAVGNGTGGPSTTPSALERAVLELEQHVAGGGWDGPVRLFALVRTAAALDRDPALAGQLPDDVITAARADAEHLTAVEQEGLPETDSLESMLARIAWPPTVDGVAVVVERIVVPPQAEANLPDDPEQARAALLNHPLRRDLRLAAGVLRDGAQMCAIRARDHDSDDRVAVGPDLIPGLTEALAQTLA